MSDPHLTHSNAADPHTTVHSPHAHHVHETPPMHDHVDEWHDHSHDPSPQHAHGEVQNSHLVLGVGIALAAVVAISCVVVYGFYVHYNTQRSSEREVTTNDAPLLKTREEKAADLAKIASGGSFQMNTETEGVKKTVTLIPIDSAMDKVAKAYTTQTPAK